MKKLSNYILVKSIFFFHKTFLKVSYRNCTSKSCHGAREKFWKKTYPASYYMLTGNNRSTRARCEICSKLTIKTPERHH